MKKRGDHSKLIYYMRLPYSYEVIPDPSGAFVVSVRELPGCLSQGDTVEEAMVRVREAMEAWLAVCIEEGVSIPLPGSDNKYSGKFVVRLPKDVHRAIAKAAERANTSMNMFVATVLAQAVGASKLLSP